MTPKKWSWFIKPDALADGLMLLLEGAIVTSCAVGDQKAMILGGNARRLLGL